MADKSIGILYIRLANDLYKIANIKVGSDGSIYIFTAQGPYHAGLATDPSKFTYHPDGKSWMTSQLRQHVILAPIADSIRKLSGFGFQNGKFYSKDFETKLPLAEVKELLYLRFGMSYNDIAHIDTNLLAQANDPKKIGQAKIIDGKAYRHLTVRFYVTHNDYLLAARDHFCSAEIFEFRHSSLPLTIIAALLDEWTGSTEEINST